MAEPFVFHFSLGAGSKPRVMYMADLYCVCRLCRHPQIQRFYHATAFHTLTPRQLLNLAQSSHLKAAYACENCGTDVGPAAVQRVVLTHGLSDDAGVIRIYSTLASDPTSRRPSVASSSSPQSALDPSNREVQGNLAVQLFPRTRLDPQAQPHWTPDPQAGPLFDTLSDAILERHFGRPLNCKIIWRDVLLDWLKEPQGGAFARVSPGYWLLADRSTSDVRDLADTLEEPIFQEQRAKGELVRIPLVDSLPAGIGTHRRPNKMHGRWTSWLPKEVSQKMAEGGLVVEAYLSWQNAHQILERTWEVGRLQWDVQGEGYHKVYTRITTPREGVYGEDIPLLAVLKRAVFTGISPGESARLTAEEVVGLLLRVFSREKPKP